MRIKHTIAKTIGYGNALKINYFFSKPKPKEMIIDICAACNAQCPFCPRIYMPEERAKGFMSIEVFTLALQEAALHGIKTIRLYSTAEPTLHPQFAKLIQTAKEKGFYIAVSTNASQLDKHVDALMNVDLLQYSIEGWDKNSYEKYRYPLKFEKIHSNIELFDNARKLRKHGPKVTSNLLLTKQTDISAYSRLWSKYIDEINVHVMLEAVVYENEKFISKKADSLLDEYYDFEPQTSDFVCGYPFNIITVAFDGKIALCCNDFSASMPLGYIQDGIDAVYNSPMMEKVRKEFYQQDLHICAGCSIFKRPKPEDIKMIKQSFSVLDPTSLAKFNFQI